MKPRMQGLLVAVLLTWPLMSRGQVARTDLAHGQISGTIFFAGNHPATGVMVELRNAAGGHIATTFSDWNGDFRFDEVPFVACIVVVQEPGYESIQERVVPGAGSFLGLQLYLQKIARDGPSPTTHLVAVRELSIPRKARKALEGGLKRLSKGDPAGSLAYFQRATQVFPGYYEAYQHMGMAHIMQGDTEKAEQAFQKSIELSKGRYANAHRALGLLFCRQHKYAAAESILRKALELEPTFPGSHYLLARALFGLNRLDEAEKHAGEAVRRTPDFPLAHLLLANIHMATHKDVELLKDLDSYLELDPKGQFSIQARQIRQEVVKRLARPDNAVAASTMRPRRGLNVSGKATSYHPCRRTGEVVETPTLETVADGRRLLTYELGLRGDPPLASNSAYATRKSFMTSRLADEKDLIPI